MLCQVRRRLAVVALPGVLLIALAAGAAPASEPTPAATATAAADSLAPPAPLPDTPMAREIREARARFQSELARLTAQYNAAATPAAARETQRAIAALKSQDEIDVLAIQARHVRAAGLTARANEIDDLIARLRAGAPDGTPAAAAR